MANVGDRCWRGWVGDQVTGYCVTRKEAEAELRDIMLTMTPHERADHGVRQYEVLSVDGDGVPDAAVSVES